MAILFDASGDILTLASDPGATGRATLTWMGRVYVVAPGNSNYGTLVQLGPLGGARSEIYIKDLGSSTFRFCLNDNAGHSDEATGAARAHNAWHHVAMVLSGTTLSLYVNGVLDFSVSGAVAAAAGESFFGNFGDGTFWFPGRLACVKWYAGRALSSAEIYQESLQQQPVVFADLFGWWPLLSKDLLANQSGGAAGTPTAGGALTTAEGPPIPWRVNRDGRRIYQAQPVTAGPPVPPDAGPRERRMPFIRR